MGRANKHDVTVTAADQLDAAKDERAHQRFAQLGIRLDESEQLFAIELDHCARFNGLNASQGSATSQQSAFAG
ncbi:MAG TPA: hypothetical protein VLD59_18135 [Steroidobacteraceae bacterium]|nr:hypothetical protein [Steroidobacteraceae bacterium]